MELTQYIRLFRRWFWLLLLAAVLGGGLSFIFRSSQPAQYQAETILSIGNAFVQPDPTQTDLRVGQDLAITYSNLVTLYEVREATVEALNLPFSADDLRRLISTRIITGTSLLVIQITYTDPILAADIANELANQLISNSPSGLTPEQRARITSANAQIEALEEQVNELNAQLQDLNVILEAGTTPEDRAELTAQRSQIITQINDATSNIAQFSAIIAELQQRTNSVEIVETARIPTEPVGQSVLVATLLGAFVGLALAAALVLALDYLRDTLQNVGDVGSALPGTPVLGVISKFGKANEAYDQRLITNQVQASRTSEEYRILRTNLLFTIGDRTLTFVVTSPSPGEGKSVTSANLAVSMALAGLRVLLIDADLRRPRVHEVFNVKNDLGLTNLLSINNQEDDDGREDGGANALTSGQNWRQCVQDTQVPGLRVITSGFLPKNPAEILGSHLMKRWANAFHNAQNIDVVIFDTPPSLPLSDATILAASVDANVVMVLNAGNTRINAAQRARERFTQIGLDIVGVVLNGVTQKEDDYYGGYYYYYYTQDGKQPQS